MNKKRTILIAVLLLLSIVNYTRITGGEHIRTIQFLSIFSIGMLSGLLVFEIASRLKNKNN
jgi:hypothetical protein